jgi:hypothetical protein
MATKRDEAIALIAARYGMNNFLDLTLAGPASLHCARKAIEEVDWAEKIGRLDQLHRSLTGGMASITTAVTP